MIKKIITFGGVHHAFLIKSIAVASGIVEKFDFWNNFSSAHAPNNEVVEFEKKFLDVVIPKSYDIFDTEIDFLMLFSEDSLYKRFYHLNNAGGITGTEFDLLVLNECFNDNISYVKKFLNCKLFDLKHGVVLEILDANSINSMREQLKLSLNSNLTETNFLLLKNNKVRNVIWFEDFYNYTSFNNVISLMLHDLGLTYKVNLQDVYEIFYSKRKKIIDSENKVKNIFSNYFLNNKNINFDLTLYEQAYFDFLVEKSYNKPIDMFYPNNQFPKTMNDYIDFHKFRYE